MQKICAKQNLEKRLAPFQFNSESPKWWQNYNDSKHKLPIGAYHGNIGNVRRLWAHWPFSMTLETDFRSF